MKINKIIITTLLILFLAPVCAFAQGWTLQNPLPTGNTLSGVWGSSSNDVFTVGYNGTILHYDGNSWSTMNSNTSASIVGIWGSSSSNVFAVCAAGAVLHYNWD